MALTCPQRELGATGLRVSRVGLGTVKLGRTAGLKYPGPVTLPDDDRALALLRAALESGVTLIDTAPAYGLSEARLGTLLPRVAPRECWTICTKAGEIFDPARAGGRGASRYDFAPASIRASIERSCSALRVTALDVALLHFGAACEDETGVIARGEALGVLLDLRRAGTVRAVGASCARVDAARAALERPAAERPDVLMLTLNSAEPAMAPVIARAAALGVGVLVKKPLGSGHLDPAASLAGVLAEPGVSAAVVGTTNARHLAEAVALAARVG